MCTKSPHNGPKLLPSHHNSTPHIILETRTTCHQNSLHVYFSPTQVHTSPSQLIHTTYFHLSIPLQATLIHTTHHNNIHQCNNNKIICNMLQLNKICKRISSNLQLIPPSENPTRILSYTSLLMTPLH